MKLFRVLLIASLMIFSIASTSLAANTPEQTNINIVQSLDLSKVYPYPSSFGLSDYKITETGKDAWISCNNAKLLIKQTAYGKIDMIIIREPSETLHGMEIGKTKWNDDIVRNNYFMRQETSPNGKTIFNYYQSDTDRNVVYIAVFEARSYKGSPIFTQFEKKYIK